MTRPVLSVTPGRHPFEIAAFFGIVLAGLWGVLVPDGRSSAIDSLFPPWFVVIYYAQLAAWGVVALAVLGTPEMERRLRLERVALYGVGYSAAAYMAAAFWALGTKGGTAGFIIGSISLASTCRIFQIGRELKKIRQAVTEPHPADPPPLAEPKEVDG